jgi:hypothetical protein
VHDFTSIGLPNVKDNCMIEDNGTTCIAKRLMYYHRIFKGFLIYHERKCSHVATVLPEDNGNSITCIRSMQNVDQITIMTIPKLMY